ncbi:uncharacterized protein LOC143184126 [Calliopsis andreniformis]|uniref:uncharacterized protein LOC143184126 n=1 Tax=Calliopsis andreniformis TaxID=337506 RepID=UPI003FCDEFEF
MDFGWNRRNGEKRGGLIARRIAVGDLRQSTGFLLLRTTSNNRNGSRSSKQHWPRTEKRHGASTDSISCWKVSMNFIPPRISSLSGGFLNGEREASELKKIFRGIRSIF